MIDDGGIEALRSVTLKHFSILDSVPERDFDELATEAARVTKTPIALISLVDEHRVWFKAAFGIELAEVDRSVAICDHTVRNSGLLVICDTTKDERCSRNPLVLADPCLRFYAGAPLLTKTGVAIGTICVLDYSERDGLSSAECGNLTVLAQRTMRLLEERRVRLDRVTLQAAA